MQTCNLKKAIMILITIASIIALYLYFDPTHSIWAPKCPLYIITGYHCPSCGVQRAIYALLHGNFAKAFMLNPLLALALPYLLLVSITTFVKSNSLTPLRNIVQHRYTAWIYITLFFAWWIIRNTPWWHAISSAYL